MFRRACDAHGALLAVNDRADVAYAAGADVLHLGQDDLPVRWRRQIIGPESADRAVHARRGRGRRGRGRARRRLLLRRAGLADADQAGAARAGPGAGPVRGRAGTDAAVVRHRRHRRVDLDQVLDAGARRVVVVRAITEAADPARRPPAGRAAAATADPAAVTRGGAWLRAFAERGRLGWRHGRRERAAVIRDQGPARRGRAVVLLRVLAARRPMPTSERRCGRPSASSSRCGRRSSR